MAFCRIPSTSEKVASPPALAECHPASVPEDGYPHVGVSPYHRYDYCWGVTPFWIELI